MPTDERIKTIMATNLQWSGSWDDVDASYPLLERQVLDSLGMIKLISLLEEEFDIEIVDDDVVPGNFLTIEHIAGLVDQKLAPGTGT
jgi:acyl carrier protein